MSKLAMKVATKWRSKPMVVLAMFAAWSALLWISINLGIEDYNTSVLGYKALPTNKLNPMLPVLVGALPMLLQVAFGFWALERGNRIAIFITIFAFSVDIGTDVYYKTQIWEPEFVAVAVTESVLLFTIGVEFLFIASLENLAEYAPDLIAVFLVLLGRIYYAFGALGRWLAMIDDRSEGDGQRRGRVQMRAQRQFSEEFD